MNAVTKIKPGVEVQGDPLAILRAPFSENQISKLPKETKAQIDERKADRRTGIRCQVCGSWHHRDAIHLDYVGHAAATDRLLDADLHWSWEPVAFGADGLPAFDKTGGLWIRLTVCGVSRLGYGHAAVKPNQDPGAREKEVIGDALRNAGMRFGMALDLWHKGDLHGPDEPDKDVAPPHVLSVAEREAQAALAGRPTRHNANQCKTVTTTRPDTGEVVTKSVLAAKLAHEMTDIMEVTELLAWRRVWEPEVSTWPLKWEDQFWANYEIHMEDLKRLAGTVEGDFREGGEETLADGESDFPGDRRAA